MLAVVVGTLLSVAVVVGALLSVAVVVGNKSDVSEFTTLVMGSERERLISGALVVVPGSVVVVGTSDELVVVGTLESVVDVVPGSELVVPGSVVVVGWSLVDVVVGISLVVVGRSRMLVNGRDRERERPWSELLVDVVPGSVDVVVGLRVMVAESVVEEVVGESVDVGVSDDLVVVGGSLLVDVVVVVGGSLLVVVSVGRIGKESESERLIKSPMSRFFCPASTMDNDAKEWRSKFRNGR